MSKRGVRFIKPDEPDFLKRLKQEIGYKEGPTVETKREKLSESTEDDDKLDDQPTVVVLQSGDLTAEEVEQEKKKIVQRENETKADLSKRILFKPTVTKSSASSSKDGSLSSSSKDDNLDNRSKSKSGDKTVKSNLLSFDTEEYSSDQSD